MVYVVKKIGTGLYAVRHRYNGHTVGTRSTQADAQRLAGRLNQRQEDGNARRPLLARCEAEAMGGALDEPTSQG